MARPVLWADGAMRILRTFAERGAPKRRVRDWTGRWWSSWGAFDLVPMGNVVLTGNPYALNPFLDASEIEVTGRDTGRVSVATGHGSYAEAVRLTRNRAGKVTEVQFAGGKGRRESVVAAEMERKYGRGKRKARHVVPAKAGTHNHRWLLYRGLLPPANTFRLTDDGGYGSPLRGDDTGVTPPCRSSPPSRRRLPAA